MYDRRAVIRGRNNNNNCHGYQKSLSPYFKFPNGISTTFYINIFARKNCCGLLTSLTTSTTSSDVIPVMSESFLLEVSLQKSVPYVNL